MKGFIDALVLVDGKEIKRVCVGVEDGKIAYIGNDKSLITSPYPYSEGQIVLPGFIDEHVHGANGADCMDASELALSTISSYLASEGTTSFLATTMTQSPKNICSSLSAVGEYVKANHATGARLLGAHLEGPFISNKFLGAQPEEYVAEPCVEVFNQYNDCANLGIKIVSLAPEEEGANALINYLSGNSIAPLAGHTNASFEHIERAQSQGLKGVTHTFNAQKGVHHRDVGTAGAALLLDELYTEAICDTVHLSIPAIKLLVKNKPKDKVILITDAIRAKGLPDGLSELGGQTVYVKGGEARLANGALAGSTLKMNVAIKNLVEKCGVDIVDAVNFASLNPATLLKVEDKLGSITKGKTADFAVLDNEFNVCLTVRDGKEVFKA